MMGGIETAHKDYKIRYLEATDEWMIRIDGEQIVRKTLTDAKKYIDNMLKSKFDRVDGYLIKGGWRHNDNFFPITVTSIVEGYYDEAWVTRKATKKRSKEPINNIALDTEKNRALIGRIVGINEEIADRRDKIAKLSEQLDRLKVDKNGR